MASISPRMLFGLVWSKNEYLNILDKYKINAGLFDALSDSKFSGDDNPYETFMKMTNQTYKLDLTLLLVNLYL